MSKLSGSDLFKYFFYTGFYKDFRFYYPIIINAFLAFFAIMNSWDFGVVIVLFGISKTLPMGVFLVKYNFLTIEQQIAYYNQFGQGKNLAKESNLKKTLRGIFQVFFIFMMIVGMLLVSAINHEMTVVKLLHWSFLLAVLIIVFRHLISLISFFMSKNRMKYFSNERHNHMVIYDIIIVFLMIIVLFIPDLEIIHFYIVVTGLELMFYLIYKIISTYSCPICRKFSSEEYFNFQLNVIHCSKCGFKFPIRK